MSTTIQVSRKTAQLLKELVKRTNAKSYDELIRNLVLGKLKTPKSLSGSNPKPSPFTERDEAELHEL